MAEQDRSEVPGPLPLPVVVQPDPMLEERAGPFRTTVIAIASAFVVVVVLYGLSRPSEPPVMASAAQTPAATPGQGTSKPTTTGSGQQNGGQQAQAPQKDAKPQQGATQSASQAQPNGGQAGPPKQGQTDAGARSDSATTGKGTAAPSDKSRAGNKPGN